MKRLLKDYLLKLLWRGARYRVSQEKPKVFAITGSVGKTSAKEALATILEGSGRPVFKTPGNLNSDMGVPLALLGFTSQPSGMAEWLAAVWQGLFPPVTRYSSQPLYILEYSADKPGDIAFLAKQIPPNVGILTRITPAHLQFYPDFAALVREKRSLIKGLAPGGVAVLNADDPQQDIATGKRRAIWYGVQSPRRERCGVWIKKIEPTPAGLLCTVEFAIDRGPDSIKGQIVHRATVQTSVVGEQQLVPLLAAAAAALEQGLSPVQIQKGMEAYAVPPGRGRIIEGKRGMTIVDDSYNASPEAVKAGLDMLRPFAAGRRVVAVLGTMNELGETSMALHEDVGAHMANRADFAILVGEHAIRMKAAAVAAGMPEGSIMIFAKPEQAVKKADQIVKKNDVIYVKASQGGMRLERVVERLMARPQDAPTQLVRQSSYWKKR
jgi:UDP-N-acetylmuramoyl-tripeptide--D-alanyl-D-alanine ligase